MDNVISPSVPPLANNVQLPLMETDISQRENADTANIISMAKESVRDAKIMIIDDEQFVIKVIKRYLSAEGYSNFISISDSRQAIQKIREELPDVVLSNINMRDVDGLEILRARQKSPVMTMIPVLILPANEEQEIKRRALELGATDFLAKPVDPCDLSLRVRNALIVKRHRDHLANYASELEAEVCQRIKQLEHSQI